MIQGLTNEDPFSDVTVVSGDELLDYQVHKFVLRKVYTNKSSTETEIGTTNSDHCQTDTFFIFYCHSLSQVQSIVGLKGGFGDSACLVY